MNNMANESVRAARLLVEPPTHVPWYLRIALWWARRKAGKEPLPGRLLAHVPRAALGAGLLELSAARAPKDLGRRELAVARLVASATVGCAFCIDMNAAGHSEAGLSRAELAALLDNDETNWPTLGAREIVVARLARSLSATPVVVSFELQDQVREAFSSREIVVLVTTISQVNFWARLCNGFGVPAAGFFSEDVCSLPQTE